MQTVYIASNLVADENDFNFEAVKHTEHVELIWLHNDGENVAQYVLEKAGKDMNFKPVTEVTPTSTAREIYTDYDLEPLEGDNYYRLMMEQKDGARIYSNIKKVIFPNIASIAVFPNPARDFTKINLENYIGKNAVVSITDVTGRYVFSNEVISITSKYHQLDTRLLKEGMYYIWVKAEGHKPKTAPLMIGK